MRRLYTGSWVINGSLQYDSVWWFPIEPKTNSRPKDDFGGDLVMRPWEEAFICFELIALVSAPQCTLWSECQYSNALQISGTRSPGTHWISTQSKAQHDLEWGYVWEGGNRPRFSFTEKLSAGQFLFQYSQSLTCFHDHSLLAGISVPRTYLEKSAAPSSIFYLFWTIVIFHSFSFGQLSFPIVIISYLISRFLGVPLSITPASDLDFPV